MQRCYQEVSGLQDRLPNGQWTAVLETTTHAVSDSLAEDHLDYLRNCNCSPLAGNAAEYDLTDHSPPAPGGLPSRDGEYHERADWTIAPNGYYGVTVIDSMTPPLVTHTQRIGDELRRWEVRDGIVSSLQRFTVPDESDSFSGAALVCCRATSMAQNLLRVARVRGSTRAEDDGHIVINLPLTPSLRSEFIDFEHGKYLLPANGYQEIAGMVRIDYSSMSGLRELEIQWLDCNGALVSDYLLRWRPGESIPSRVAEDHYLVGTGFLHTRREATMQRIYTEAAALSPVQAQPGQVVIDRRFGLPKEYVASPAGELPSEDTAARSVELNSTRLATQGVSQMNVSNPVLAYPAAPSNGGEPPLTSPESPGRSSHLLAWRVASLLFVCLLGLGVWRKSRR